MPLSSRHDLPYPDGTDSPDVAGDLAALVAALDAKPIVASGTVTFTLSSANNSTEPILFPSGRFTAAPRVVAVQRGTGQWNCASGSVTSTGADLTVRHIDGTNTTGSVIVDWVAVQE